MRLLIVGYGRMGRLVEALSPEYGFQVADCLDIHNNVNAEGITAERLKNIDVAIDFSTAEAIIQNFPKLAELGINLVIGTTGWKEHEDSLKRVATNSGIGVVAAANFSLSVNLFQIAVEHMTKLFEQHKEYGAWVHESHHIAKKDAPSGTALAILDTMKLAGYKRSIDISSTRAGSIPGTHTVGFDGPSETITLTHTARDRAMFARGALEAARWIHKKSGWCTMHDVFSIEQKYGG